MAVFDEAWWHVFFGAFHFFLRPEHAASRAGVHIGDTGRVADPPPWVGGQRTRTGKNPRRHRPCRQKMHQNTHRAGFCGDVVDLDVKSSCRRYGAERADPRRRPLQARWAHASAKKNARKGAQRRERSAALRNDILSVRTMIGVFIQHNTEYSTEVQR